MTFFYICIYIIRIMTVWEILQYCLTVRLNNVLSTDRFPRRSSSQRCICCLRSAWVHSTCSDQSRKTRKGAVRPTASNPVRASQYLIPSTGSQSTISSPLKLEKCGTPSASWQHSCCTGLLCSCSCSAHCPTGSRSTSTSMRFWDVSYLAAVTLRCDR